MLGWVKMEACTNRLSLVRKFLRGKFIVRGLEKRQPFLKTLIMEKGINYKEGDRITPKEQFPPVLDPYGIPTPEKGKGYTCDGLEMYKGILVVFLKERQEIVPPVVIYLGMRFTSPVVRVCYHADKFTKLEQYADMTTEIAQQFKEHPDTVDQPVKVLEVQN